MKKMLLSLAVIATSGAYVAYENLGVAKTETDASANSAALQPAMKPADAVLPAPAPDAGAGATAPEVTQSAVASPTTPAPPTTNVAATSAFSTLQVPMPSAPTVRVADVAASQTRNPAAPVADAPAVPPIPLPRPADAPSAALVAQTAASPSGYRDGTFKGVSADAYYGRVQVDAVIKGGRLIAVDVLSYPSDRRTSRYINSRALPELEQEAIQAQSANIDGVSGATLTSGAYEESLDAALSTARTGGNNA